MVTNKKMDLTGVQKTLLLSLVGRAAFSKLPYSPIKDYKAIEIVNALNYDATQLLLDKHFKISILCAIARAYHFDQAIKKFLNQYPRGTIVNLGCGLDTTFNRVDNGLLTWIDIDLPEVIRLREKLLPPSAREHYIAKSILDDSWMEEVKKYGDNVFFFAGGLLMYLNEKHVKATLLKMALKFPRSKLVFDNCSPKGISFGNDLLKQYNIHGVMIKWGILKGSKLKKWSSRIKSVKEHSYFIEIKSKYSFPIRLKLLMYKLDLFQKSGIIYVEFR